MDRDSAARALRRAMPLVSLLALIGVVSASQAASPAVTGTTEDFGPYNVEILEGGVGLTRSLSPRAAVLASGAPWSLTGWVRLAAESSGGAPSGTASSGTAAPGMATYGLASSGAAPSGRATSETVSSDAATSRAASARAAIIAGFGDASSGQCDCVVLGDGKLQLWLSGGTRLRTGDELPAGAWHAIAATYDGRTARLYLDGRLIGSMRATTAAAQPQVVLAPVTAPTAVPVTTPIAASGTAPSSTTPIAASGTAPTVASANAPATASDHFGGSIAHWLVHSGVLSTERIARLASQQPDFDLIEFYRVGAGWPLQEHAWRGLQQPQDPWTLPKSRASMEPWKPRPAANPPRIAPDLALRSAGQGTWVVNGWRLAAAPGVAQDGKQISSPGFQDQGWYDAVVPGTVLTTLVARGVYPDPYYGLNNLRIPERLSRQDYWYRTVFSVPATWRGRHITLRFNGINYAGAVWLNGMPLGETRGAFVRGTFDVTGRIQPGRVNVLAVRVSPPPHPGIPYEKSIVAGPGNNGGHMALDGPTFIATEGWDWMPPVRDRDTGIWQDVELHTTGSLLLHDPHVVTHLPLPRTNAADVSIGVSVENRGNAPTPATIVARFGTVTVRDTVTAAPGLTRVRLTPAQFPALHVQHPRLWWPNGYGAPNLYTLHLSIYDGPTPHGAGDRAPSDTRKLRFGIRELTYELSLFDSTGKLRRVVVDPTRGTLLGEGALIDVSHRAIKQTPNGWAASLTRAGETSPAVQPTDSTSLSPYLVIRVNGVRIAARGGSWGMDDAMKRVSRARLEPYFRLTRQAHLNIIRNWLGQDTEETFYRLADEYGLLVLNDFWESTQDFQLEADDPQLFLANARQVLLRYRNHPSVAVWFGRNEGVPQPSINNGLARLITSLDGTRLYLGSSNRINLQGSGPYDYRPPVQYFTQLARGFSVEVGTVSLASLRSLEAMTPPADRWPVSDTLAYHDWNFGGNGDVRVFMNAMDKQLGAPDNLEDFERKAQLMDFVTYRAIFEGFNAGLWTVNSGRLLWMTQPAWPSNIWQIYTSDYDTAGAFYGVKTACEPIHAQMNLPDFSLTVVDTTRQPRSGLKLESRIFSLEGRLLATRTDTVNVGADSITTLPPLALAKYLRGGDLAFVELDLESASGELLSRNVYWQGRTAHSLRHLDELQPQQVAIVVRGASNESSAADDHSSGAGHGPSGGARDSSGTDDESPAENRESSPADARFTVELVNHGNEPAVAAHIMALDSHGHRVLPVYYSDNYVTLLPGEHLDIQLRCPANGSRCARIALDGWNVVPASASVSPGQAPHSQSPEG